MTINKINSGHSTSDIADALIIMICESRFTADIVARKRTVDVSMVRLRERKLYCGNHPKACERAVHGKHRRGSWLEGADWVEFDDSVNDVLDRMSVDCDFKSAFCIIRKGRRRRIFYDANTQQNDGNWQWDKDGPDDHYSDNCGGKVPFKPSEFPFGTPGIHVRMDYYCVGAHDHDHHH